MRGFAALHPPDDFEFTIRSDIPLSGGLGTSAAAIVAGLVAADSIFELGADLLGEATRLEGHPDNVAAALLGGFVLCSDGHAERFDPPPDLECLLVVPEQAVRTQKAREALPSRIPVADAVFNIAHASLLVLGLARGDLGLVARGLGDRIHQPRRAHLYPRSWELVQQARASWARSGRRSPAPARPCSSGATSSPPAPSQQRLDERRRGLGRGPPRPVHAHGRRRPLAVIVLLHGFMDSPRTWDLRAAVPGRRGGARAGAAGPPRRAAAGGDLDLAAHVERVLDEAGVEQAHLVGNSLGGYIALGARHARPGEDGRGARAGGRRRPRGTLALQERSRGRRGGGTGRRACSRRSRSPGSCARATALLTVRYEHSAEARHLIAAPPRATRRR